MNFFDQTKEKLELFVMGLQNERLAREYGFSPIDGMKTVFGQLPSEELREAISSGQSLLAILTGLSAQLESL